MINLLLISALGVSLSFINPADPSLSTIYPSGVKDVDAKIFSAPPATDAPLLRIGTPLKSADGYVIQPGCYLVKTSVDDKKLMFFQGHNLVFEADIIESHMGSVYKAKPEVEIEIFENDKLLIIYSLENVVKKVMLPIK